MNPSTGIKPDRSQWPSWHHRLNTNSFVGGGAGEGLEDVQEGVDPAGGSPLEWNWNGSSPMIIPGQPQQHPSDDGNSNGGEQCKASLLLGGGQALRPLNSLANSCANLPLYYSSTDGGGNIWAGIHLNSGNGNELTTEVAGNSIFPASTEAFSRSSGIQALLTCSNALSQYQGVNSMMSDTQRQLLELLDTMHRQQRYSTTVDETLLVPRENLHFNGDYGLDLSVPPPLALNLGGRTFFSMGNNHPSAAALFQHLGRRPRYSSPAIQVPFCQAQGCKADLTMAKHYHRRHKVCELHSKAASVVISGSTQRFCQQCSRFHALSEFDDGKRSCRKRLADHNRRRRKAQPTSNTVADTPTTASNPTLPKAFTTQPSSDDSGSTGSQTLALTCNPSTEYPAMSLTPRLSTALLKGIPPPTATETKSERTDMHTDDESFKSPPANCNSPSLSLSTNIGVGGVPSSSSTSTYTKKHPMASESQAMYYGGLELPVVSWLRPIPHESINSSSSSAATLQSPPALDSPASLSSPRDHAMPEQVSRRQYFSSSLQNLLPLNTNINTNQPHLAGCFGSPIKPKRQEVLSLLEGGEDEAVTNLEHSHYTTQLASDFLQNRFHSRASTQDGHDNALHHSQH